ncbi:MAG: DUF1800 family protein, partial [Bacteroidota bacterium]
NENYARELLELFTIGKGDAAGPGDYTNYTEDDVVAIARVLTGWRHVDFSDLTLVQSSFIPNRHDTGDKQLSHRFNNMIITDQGEEEYKAVIDIIFQQDEVARFICRKLYRWFVGSDIHSDIEVNIIEPMSQMLIADSYNVKPALMALLSSEHFYEEAIRGCMISHPLDFLFKMVNVFELDLSENYNRQYRTMADLFVDTQDLEMVIFNHPNVAGWKAFYQAPQFYKIWMNAVTLPVRSRLTDKLLVGFNILGFRIELDVLALAATLDNPADPNDLIHELASIFFVYPISQEQLTTLKDILIPGLPDFEWQVEYLTYISGSQDLEEAVENKLKALIGTMLKMPEFYLM